MDWVVKTLSVEKAEALSLETRRVFILGAGGRGGTGAPTQAGLILRKPFVIKMART